VLSFTRILIASDDESTAAFLDLHLREWGYVPYRAADGREALQILTEGESPRIAILDIDLPGLSGVEVASEVHAREGTRSVWTVLLCDHVDGATIAHARDAGVDDLVVKPLDTTDLRIRVGVAERVQMLAAQLDLQTRAANFHAQHDNLTGLWNREALLRMLFAETDRVQRLKTPLALVLLDLDHFGRLNETYGYEAGDGILKELARRFRRYLRTYDLIGRCGDDEFLIALPGCTSEQAVALARRVKRGILGRPFPARPGESPDELVGITASTGISHSLGRTPLVVLHEAERALHLAKNSGRNCERQFSDVDPPESNADAEIHLVAAQNKR
jgi:two-component system, cell cycle response regulator